MCALRHPCWRRASGYRFRGWPEAGTAGEEEQEGLLAELGWRRIKHCVRCELMARRDFFELVSRKHMAAAELSGLFRI